MKSLLKRVRRVVLVVGLLSLGLAGCRRDAWREPRSVRETDWRAIRSEPVEVFSTDSILNFALHQESRFDGGAVGSWTFAEDSGVKNEPGGLLLPTSPNSPILLEASVDIDAGEVAVLEVEVPNRNVSNAVLYWSPPGEEPTAARSLRLNTWEVKSVPLRFTLAGHSGWSGRIGRLRLAFRTSGPRPRITAIRMFGATNRPRAIESLAGKAMLVDRGRRREWAIVAAPNHRLEYEVSIPDEARLELALRAASAAPCEQAFIIELEDQPSGARWTRLFERRYPLDAATAGASWEDVVVDLSKWSGATTRLALETRSGCTKETKLWDLPAWGNPEILGRRKSSRPNLVIILVDTLRADHLESYGYGRSTAPQIHTWATESAVLFERAFAQAPWTLPSHASLFSGRWPFRLPLNFDAPAPRGEEAPDPGADADVDVALPASAFSTLAEHLVSQGYRTAAIVGGAYLHPHFGLDQGFQQYVTRNANDSWEAELEENLAEAQEWLRRSSERPFFLFFHTYEVHGPFFPREPFYSAHGGTLDGHIRLRTETLSAPSASNPGTEVRRAFSGLAPEPSSVLRGHSMPNLLYDSAIAYMDERIAQLLAAVDRAGLMDNTIVVLTSDHGESLGERGLANHTALYEHNLHVPLIFSIPGLPARRVREAVALIDVLPTVLDLLSLPTPDGTDGVSLAGALLRGKEPEPRIIYSYAASTNFGVAVRRGALQKLIMNDTAWEPLRGRVEIFDLAEGDLGPASREVGEVARTLQRDLSKRFVHDWHGLHVQVASGSETLELSIRAETLKSTQVRSLKAPANSLKWGTNGEVGITLGPHERLHVVLMLDRARALELRVGGFDRAIQLSGPELAECRALSWPDLESMSLDSGSNGGRVEVCWRTDLERDEASQPSREVEGQLRALGYL